jgi:hypothetical protein
MFHTIQANLYILSFKNGQFILMNIVLTNKLPLPIQFTNTEPRNYEHFNKPTLTNLTIWNEPRGLGPQANYTDLATAKLVTTFVGRKCCVFSATNSHGCSCRFSRPEPLLFHSSSSSIVLTRLEWTPFQTPYFLENLVGPEIEPGTFGSVARNSDH